MIKFRKRLYEEGEPEGMAYKNPDGTFTPIAPFMKAYISTNDLALPQNRHLYKEMRARADSGDLFFRDLQRLAYIEQKIAEKPRTDRSNRQTDRMPLKLTKFRKGLRII